MWNDAFALRLRGEVQLSCVDETSLSTETVLAPSRFSFALEKRSTNDPEVSLLPCTRSRTLEDVQPSFPRVPQASRAVFFLQYALELCIDDSARSQNIAPG